MYSGSSESICSVAHGPLAIGRAVRSWYQWSRSGSMVTSWPVRFTTITFSTDGEKRIASSTMSLSLKMPPFTQEPSAVMTSFDSESSIRSASASEENPAKITECTAPSFAAASIANTTSGIRGR